TGDFNTDGHADLLWQNTSGQGYIWEMNGTSVIGTGDLGNPGSSWHAIGTGDFNADGHSDILWQNDDGAGAIWAVDGLSVSSAAILGNPGSSWHALGTGDYNGDGKSDIQWQSIAGDGQLDASATTRRPCSRKRCRRLIFSTTGLIRSKPGCAIGCASSSRS